MGSTRPTGMSKGEELHAQHRKRMMQKFTQFGLEIFDEHEILEMLLYNCLRRSDTSPLAHRLINHFGSLCAVLDAPMEEIAKVEGAGPITAQSIYFFRELFKRYQSDKEKPGKEVYLTSTEEAGKYFVRLLRDEQEEVVLAAFVANNGRLLQTKTLSRGTVNSSVFDYVEIARTALLSRASGILLAHNHPEGRTEPSAQDISVTRKIYSYLNQLGLHLLDHIIVAGNEYDNIIKKSFC